MEVTVVVLILCILILFVVVVGHGAWVVCATLIQALTHNPKKEALERELQDLDAAWREIERLYGNGKIATDLFRFLGIQLEARYTEKGCPKRLSFRDSSDRVGATSAERANSLRKKPAGDSGQHSVADQTRSVPTEFGEEVTRPERSRSIDPHPTGSTPPAAIGEQTDVADQTTPEFQKHDVVGNEPILAQVVEPTNVDVEPTSVNRDEHPSEAPVAHRLDAGHPLDVEYLENKPQPHSVKRRFYDVLHTFMQDKNIRWGELVSGLLIIGSAMGLVISLRRTLADTVPYFPAALFMLITGSIHAAGIYTLRRWKLETTSRGVLLIGLLLVPLNFLAACLLSEQRPITDPAYLAAVLVGVIGFGAMTYYSSRCLMENDGWKLTLVILGASVSQLVVNRIVHPGLSATALNLVALLPIACFSAGVIAILRPSIGSLRLGRIQAEQVVTILGVGAFSLASVGGLLLFKAGDWLTTISELSVCQCFIGSTLLFGGLSLYRRSSTRETLIWRTTGASLAVFAGSLMLIAIALAWPHPEYIAIVGILNFAVLAVAAWRGRFPSLAGIAYLNLGLAFFVVVHWIRIGNDGIESALTNQILSTIMTSATSIMLTLLSAIGIALVIWFRSAALQRRLEPVTQMLLVAASISASIGLILAIGVGLTSDLAFDQWSTTLILAGYTALLLAIQWHFRNELVGYAVGGAALLTIVYLFVWNDSLYAALSRMLLAPEHRWIAALMAYSYLMLGIGGIWRVARTRSASFVQPAVDRLGELLPFLLSACTGATVTFGLALIQLHDDAWILTFTLAAASLIWLLVAEYFRVKECFLAFQGFSTMTLMTGAFALWRTLGYPLEFWSADHFLVQLMTLSIISAAWNATPYTLSKEQLTAAFVTDHWRVIPNVIAITLVVLLFFGGLLTVMPGVVHELGLTFATVVDLDWPYGNDWLAWSAIAAVATAYAAAGMASPRRLQHYGWWLVSLAIAFKAADEFAVDESVASALRWSLMAVAMVHFALHVARQRLGLGDKTEATDLKNPVGMSVNTLCSMVLVGMPILVLTGIVAILSASGFAVRGPVEGSLFERLGMQISYAVPVGWVIVELFAISRLERRPDIGFGGSLVLQYLVGLIFMMRFGLPDIDSEPEQLVTLLQWSACAFSGYMIIWIMFDKFSPEGRIESPLQSRLLNYQVQLSLLWPLLISMVLVIWKFITPGELLVISPSVASMIGVVTTSLVMAAICLYHVSSNRKHSYWGPAAVALFGLLIASVDRWDRGVYWSAFHLVQAMMLSALFATAFLLTTKRIGRFTFDMSGRASAKSDTAEENRRKHHTVNIVCWVIAILLYVTCLRAAGVEWGRPWWSVSFLVLLTAASGMLAHGVRSIAYTFFGAITVQTALLIGWFELASPLGLSWVECVEAIITLASVYGMIWLAVECYQQRSGRNWFDNRSIRVHRITILVLLAGLLQLLLLVVLSANWPPVLNELQSRTSGVALAMATIALGVYSIGMLWDSNSRLRIPVLYLYGWNLALLLPVVFVTSYKSFLTIEIISLSIWITVVGFAFATRYGSSRTLNRMGVCHWKDSVLTAEKWIPVVQLAMGTLVLVFASAIVLSHSERAFRFGAAFAALGVALGVTLTATAGGQRVFKHAALIVWTIFFVLTAWADLNPQEAMIGLLRVSRLTLTMAATTILMAFAFPKLFRINQAWSDALKRFTPQLIAATCVSLVGVFYYEYIYFDSAPHHPLQAIAVGVVLIGMSATLIVMAVLPERDPLALSVTGRMGYVYVAQALAGLTLLHFFLSQPDWFDVRLRPYWPYIVMGVAFVTGGLGELLQRHALKVVGQPLQATASLLPVLPAIVMMFVTTHSNHAVLLVMAGLLYVMLSLSRGSMLYASAGILFGNMALWSFYSDFPFLRFHQHPQLWLIPPAISVLVATRMLRNKIPASQLVFIRYACVVVIYISSTSEVMMTGIGRDLAPPMILAVLSVAGVLLGILLHVRAYLYLGSTFLFLSMVSMVSHAHQHLDHVWPWWAFGIGMGIVILVGFGFLEKKRPEITEMIGKMKKWET